VGGKSSCNSQTTCSLQKKLYKKLIRVFLMKFFNEVILIKFIVL
jgi:hypothetical protein